MYFLLCRRYVVGSKISGLIVRVGCLVLVQVVFSVRMYSGDSFLCHSLNRLLLQIPVVLLCGNVWARFENLVILHILVTAVTIFSLCQEAWSVEGGFTLHSFGSVKKALCCA